MTSYKNLNLHIRAFSTVSALSGGTATQCMESTVIIRSPRLDMKQNKSALAVRICLQMHFHHNINHFPPWLKKVSDLSIWSNEDARV